LWRSCFSNEVEESNFAEESTGTLQDTKLRTEAANMSDPGFVVLPVDDGAQYHSQDTSESKSTGT